MLYDHIVIAYEKLCGTNSEKTERICVVRLLLDKRINNFKNTKLYIVSQLGGHPRFLGFYYQSSLWVLALQKINEEKAKKDLLLISTYTASKKEGLIQTENITNLRKKKW